MTPVVFDINADVGERPEARAGGAEQRLLEWVTSINIACGGHAGSPASMEALVLLAGRLGLAVGAHPGYPDPAHFGRRSLAIPAARLAEAVAAQTQALADIAAAHGAVLRHVKPHGALYNDAAADAQIAEAIGAGLRPWRGAVTLVGLAGSRMLEVWRGQGFQVAAEAFADRLYEPDGTLRPRRFDDALITDPQQAARQALEIVLRQRVISSSGAGVRIEAQTLCVHSDTPSAVDIARTVREQLTACGIQITPLPPAQPDAPR